VLLLTPGFFTDAIGLCLLLPPVRSALIQWGIAKSMRGNFIFTNSAGLKPNPRESDVVDAEFTVLDEEEEPKKPGDSGWTKP
jgi:UPF0716 protein FxsA